MGDVVNIFTSMYAVVAETSEGVYDMVRGTSRNVGDLTDFSPSPMQRLKGPLFIIELLNARKLLKYDSKNNSWVALTKIELVSDK